METSSEAVQGGETGVSDISSLIMNQIRTALEALHHSGVGFIDEESTEGFDYIIDGRVFNIAVLEDGEEKKND